MGDTIFKSGYDENDFKEGEWVILKVGISKPGSLSDRLNEEARRYKKNIPMFVGLPCLQGVNTRTKLEDADYLSQLLEQPKASRSDLIFVVKCDIGHEDQLRNALGPCIGVAHKKRQWENWLNLHEEDYTAFEDEKIEFTRNGETKAVTKVQALNIGFGETVLCKKSIADQLQEMFLQKQLTAFTLLKTLKDQGVPNFECLQKLKAIYLFRYENDQHPMRVTFLKYHQTS